MAQNTTTDEKKKTRACTECHRSKNKCAYNPEQQHPGQRPRCERCIRLDKHCIPHLSRQGKRKNRLTVENAPASMAMSNANNMGGGMPNGNRRQSIDSSPNISMLSNQAQILDMVETNNLQQLSTSLNLNMFANGGVMPQQQQHQQQQQQMMQGSSNQLQGLADNILSSSGAGPGNQQQQNGQQGTSSNNSLTLLLNQAMNERMGNTGVSNVNALGGGNNLNNSGGNTMTQQIDQAKLSMMISQLSNNSSTVQNISGSTNTNPMGNQLGGMGNFNPNMGGGPGGSMTSASPSQPLPQSTSSNSNLGGGMSSSHQPSAAALMMLAGHAGTTAPAAAMPPSTAGSVVGNPGIIPTSLNNLNTTKFNKGRRRATVQAHGPPTVPVAKSTSQVYSRSLDDQQVGMRSSFSLGGMGAAGNNNNNMNNNMGNTSNINNNMGSNQGAGNSNMGSSNQGGGNSYLNNTNTNANLGSNSTSERLLKKQKKAHLLPDAPLPANVPYPAISLLPNDKDNQNNNGNNSGNKKSSTDKPKQHNHHRSSSIDSNNDSNQNALSRSSSTANLNYLTPEDAIGNHIARACAKHSGQKLTSLKNHYGLQCQIREWISMALTRRSFALLGKASSLANRCGIHMDRILCGVAEKTNDDDVNGGSNGGAGIGSGAGSCAMGGRMNYLLSTILEPRSQQILPVDERHMLIPRLPTELLNVVGCQNCPTFQSNQLRNRWIIIRETHRGTTRFYTSPAFERNVLSWRHISQIYEDNLADINSLIFVKDDFRKFLACNAHQISLHSSPGMPPVPVHAPKTKIRLLGRQWGKRSMSSSSGCGGNNNDGTVTKEMIREVQEGNAMTLEMDLRFVSFPSMDKTIYYLEFFHHSRDGNSSTGTGNSWTRNLSDDSLNKTAAALVQQQQQNQQQQSQQQQQQQQQSSVSFSNDTANNRPTDRIVSESPAREEPPMFDDVIDCEEWVGINDVLASGDIDDLLTALLD